MTLEAVETFEIVIDYSEQLDSISEQLAEISEYQQKISEFTSAYLPEIYNNLVLILGTIIALVVFRLLTTFIARVFNDTTKF